MSTASNHSGEEAAAARDVMIPMEPLLSADDADTTSLARIMDTAAFSQIAPKLKAAFEYMDQPGAPFLGVLTDNIQQLQDAFVEALYAFFSRNAVNLSQKLTLHLNDEKALMVSGEHPEKDRLNILLAVSTELSAAFAELASQSSALKDLQSLQAMVMSSLPSDKPVKLTASHSDPAYRMSIKGEMNHFYFSVSQRR